MTRRFAAVAFLALASCNQPAPIDDYPVGRYQMMASGNERHEVYVLDTETGTIWACSAMAAPLTVGCGIPRTR